MPDPSEIPSKDMWKVLGEEWERPDESVGDPAQPITMVGWLGNLIPHPALLRMSQFFLLFPNTSQIYLK